jgi:hypothetical protein
VCSCKVPVIPVGFSRNLNFLNIVSKENSNIRFHQNPSSGSRVVPNGQTDGHDETNSLFRNFAKESDKLANHVSPFSLHFSLRETKRCRGRIPSKILALLSEILGDVSIFLLHTAYLYFFTDVSEKSYGSKLKGQGGTFGLSLNVSEINKYQHTLRYNPEKRRPHLHRNESHKFLIFFKF